MRWFGVPVESVKTLTRVVMPALVVFALVASAADARPWSWLGVRIRDLSEQEMEEIATRHGIREGFGVVIVEVIADTPAARRTRPGSRSGTSSFRSATVRCSRAMLCGKCSPSRPSTGRSPSRSVVAKANCR